MITVFLRRLSDFLFVIGAIVAGVGGFFLLIAVQGRRTGESDLPWFMTLIAALLTLGGVSMVGLAIWKALRAAWLVGYGRVTDAVVIAIPSDESVTINDRHPRFLRYQFVLPASNEKVKADGPRLSRREEAKWHIGDKLRIAYDPQDPRMSTPLPDPR